MRLHLYIMALAISLILISCSGNQTGLPVVPSENSNPVTILTAQTDNLAADNRYTC